MSTRSEAKSPFTSAGLVVPSTRKPERRSVLLSTSMTHCSSSTTRTTTVAASPGVGTAAASGPGSTASGSDGALFIAGPEAPHGRRQARPWPPAGGGAPLTMGAAVVMGSVLLAMSTLLQCAPGTPLLGIGHGGIAPLDCKYFAFGLVRGRIRPVTGAPAFHHGDSGHRMGSSPACLRRHRRRVPSPPAQPRDQAFARLLDEQVERRREEEVEDSGQQ